MASDNMNIVIKGHLKDQQRLQFLQPWWQDGAYPWTEAVIIDGGKVSSAEASITVSSTNQGMVTSSSATSRKRCMGDTQDPPTQKRLISASKPSSGDPSPILQLQHPTQ